MIIYQVREFFRNKKDFPCPLTEQLIKAGYKQKTGGYIDKARKLGISNPTQYWHLMSYCDSVDENKEFGKNIVCGELIIWMAEVAEAVPKEELGLLVDEIIAGDVTDRKKWNKRIQDVCLGRVRTLLDQC